jgi:P-type Ca2+ transporter type 2C
MTTSLGTDEITVSAPWHAIPPHAVLHRLGSRAQGLTAAEAAERLARHGSNVFRSAPAVSAWSVLFSQFRSVIVLLLVVAAALAVVTGEALDGVAIVVVLILNVALGFFTELRASRAMEALLRLEVSHATVIRGGQTSTIDARDLVPGDLIEIEAGQTVPADARLLSSSELRVMEGSLTGESVPVDKEAGAVVSGETPLSDRRTMIYKTTSVGAGRARAVVVATGMQTEVGRIGRLVEGVARKPTPLEQRLHEMGRGLVGVAIVVAVLVAATGLRQERGWVELVQTAIALAVAAVPEGLPVVGTIALAAGTWRMARRHALIRRLPVVESLGSATVICTDKTGTLTSGAMTCTVIRFADRQVEISGAGYIPEGQFTTDGAPVNPLTDTQLETALRIAALASRGDVVKDEAGWKPQGDPTEVALVIAARKGGLGRTQLQLHFPEVAEIPFSSERMVAATYHRTPQGIVAYVKGAPARILELATSVLTVDGVRPIRNGERDELLEQNRTLARQGMRVIALATMRADGKPVGELAGLVWIGLAGLMDPPADGVAETIVTLRRAGIRTIMLTGDQRLTALAVARQLHVIAPGEHAVDGRELDQLSEDALLKLVATTSVFSRVSPRAKLRIVDAYQKQGEIVAMLGDGVNDAAALRKADVGVAMGLRGTDLAKEAADVILEDDRFTTIAAAVEEGRVIFDNIRKFVFYLFSCNLAEILVMFGAGVAGLPAPLRPIQILWLNLLTDTLPALALALEPGERGIMRQPPRDPRRGIVSPRMLRAIAGYGLFIAACALGVFAWALAEDGNIGRAATMTFMTLALAQILHLGNARSEGPVTTLRRIVANRFALGAVALAILLQLISLTGFGRVMGWERLGWEDWLTIGIIASLPAVAGQTIKTMRAAINTPPARQQAVRSPEPESRG